MLKFLKKHSATIVALLAMIFVVISWIVTKETLVGRGKADRGTFGDMFGGLNALFSGLAFVGLIYAILLQRQELSLQREELKATRKELAGQREEQQKQNKFIELQTFENTFFQMVRTLNEIVNSIDFRNTEGAITTQGRDCFLVFENRLLQRIKKRAPSDLETLDAAYQEYYVASRSDLGHYYRVLYTLTKFVHNSKIAHKRLYTNIIRAQLSGGEVVLLFYNCLSKLGSEKFKPLVEEYALLKLMPAEKILNIKIFEEYDRRAFGGNEDIGLYVSLGELLKSK